MTEQNETTKNLPIEYVAVGPHGWARDSDATDCLLELIHHISLDPPYGPEGETVSIMVVECRGFQSIGGIDGSVSAEETLSVTDYELDKSEVRELREMSSDLFIKAEDILYNSPSEKR